MSGVRLKVGNPYQFDWEEEVGISASPLLLPRRFFNEPDGFEVALPGLPQEGSLLGPLPGGVLGDGAVKEDDQRAAPVAVAAVDVAQAVRQGFDLRRAPGRLPLRLGPFRRRTRLSRVGGARTGEQGENRNERPFHEGARLARNPFQRFRRYGSMVSPMARIWST